MTNFAKQINQGQSNLNLAALCSLMQGRVSKAINIALVSAMAALSTSGCRNEDSTDPVLTTLTQTEKAKGIPTDGLIKRYRLLQSVSTNLSSTIFQLSKLETGLQAQLTNLPPASATTNKQPQSTDNKQIESFKFDYTSTLKQVQDCQRTLKNVCNEKTFEPIKIELNSSIEQLGALALCLEKTGQQSTLAEKELKNDSSKTNSEPLASVQKSINSLSLINNGLRSDIKALEPGLPEALSFEEFNRLSESTARQMTNIVASMKYDGTNWVLANSNQLAELEKKIDQTTAAAKALQQTNATARSSQQMNNMLLYMLLFRNLSAGNNNNNYYYSGPSSMRFISDKQKNELAANAQRFNSSKEDLAHSLSPNRAANGMFVPQAKSPAFASSKAEGKSSANVSKSNPSSAGKSSSTSASRSGGFGSSGKSAST